MEQATEAISTLHRAIQGDDRVGWRTGHSLIEALVRPGLVVVIDELGQHFLQVPPAEDPSVHHPVRDDHKPPPYSGDGGPGEGVAQVVDLWITEPSFPEILATRGALPYGGQAPGADSLKIPTPSRCPSPEVSPPVLTSRTGLT